MTPLDPTNFYVVDDPHKFPLIFPTATPTRAGMLSGADKEKLDALTPGGTLAAAYVAGGGNGGSDNQLGEVGVGMDQSIVLLAQEGVPVIEVDNQIGAIIVTLGVDVDRNGVLIVNDRNGDVVLTTADGAFNAVSPQAHGTLYIGGGLGSSDADINRVMLYQPAEVVATPWGLTFAQFVNASGSRKNQTMALGLNTVPDAVANEASIGWSFESFYKFDINPAHSEMHAFMNAPDGTSRRVLSMNQNLTTGIAQLLSFADEAELGNNDAGVGSGSLVWSTNAHSVYMQSPDQLSQMYVDNNVVRIKVADGLGGTVENFTTGGPDDYYFRTNVSTYGARSKIVDLGTGPNNLWRNFVGIGIRLATSTNLEEPVTDAGYGGFRFQGGKLQYSESGSAWTNCF